MNFSNVPVFLITAFFTTRGMAGIVENYPPPKVNLMDASCSRLSQMTYGALP